MFVYERGANRDGCLFQISAWKGDLIDRGEAMPFPRNGPWDLARALMISLRQRITPGEVNILCGILPENFEGQRVLKIFSSPGGKIKHAIRTLQTSSQL